MTMATPRAAALVAERAVPDLAAAARRADRARLAVAQEALPWAGLQEQVRPEAMEVRQARRPGVRGGSHR